MAKKKIKGDGENKEQMKFELNHELPRLEKAPESSSPTFNQITPRATCAQLLDGDSATFQGLTTLSMTKFSLISKTTAPHYCQISLVMHALLWRSRGALQGQGLAALRAKPQDVRAGFQPCLWGGWRV